jgi:hypothetical protein
VQSFKESLSLLYPLVIDDKKVSDSVLKYLNSFPEPDNIGVTYNKSYRVDKFKPFGFFSRKIYLVVESLTVNCYQGDRTGVDTFENKAWAFNNENDSNKFCYLSNKIFNREKSGET